MKITLCMEDLSVTTFETLSPSAFEGTVIAFEESLSDYCATIGGLWTQACASCIDANNGAEQEEAQEEQQKETPGGQQQEVEGEQQEGLG